MTEDADITTDEMLRTDPKAYFTSQGLRTANIDFASLEAVQSNATIKSYDIIQSWLILRAIIYQHEGTIRKRWQKKSRKGREAILVQAFPGISKQHNPSLHQHLLGLFSQEATLFPHLNLEDLGQSTPLLLFLSARSRTHPKAWIAHDSHPLVFGKELHQIQRMFLYGYRMHFTEDIHQVYATLKVDGLKKHQHAKHNLDMMPHSGTLALLIQRDTLSFLVKVCQLILHDISDLTFDSPRVPIVKLPEPASHHLDLDHSSSEHVSLSTIAAEAPYRAPSTGNLGALLAVVQAQIEAAKDHLWGLRQDPGYFMEIVRDSSVHYKEFLRNKRDWQRTIENIIYMSLINVQLWSKTAEWIQDIIELQQRQEDFGKLDIGNWSDEYIDAVIARGWYLHCWSAAPRALVKEAIFHSPPLRHFWRDARYSETSARLMVKKEYQDDPLPILLSMLTMSTPGDATPMYPVTDQIERLLAAEPTQRAKITSHVQNILSDIRVYEEVNRQFHEHSPMLSKQLGKQWSPEAPKDVLDKSRSMLDETFPLALARAIQSTDLAAHGTPTEGRFVYPADKRRTAQRTVQMQRAEQQLDLFWAGIDRSVDDNCGGWAAFPTLDFSDRVLERTQDWISPPSKPTSVESIGTPLSLFSLDPGKQNAEESVSSKADFPPAKLKTKTRGIESSESKLESLNMPLSTQSNPIGKIVFKLKSRDMKVFRTLFHQPSHAGEQGQVKWLDLVHAMAATGFTYQSLGGSAWQFTPPVDPGHFEVQRGISFHEPHPESKISFWMARQVGRRLQRVYGWSIDSFVLSE